MNVSNPCCIVSPMAEVIRAHGPLWALSLRLTLPTHTTPFAIPSFVTKPLHAVTSCGQPSNMGKAYNPEQRVRVKQLLEAGRDEESIEKETGVSDRTIRRWKIELERTGRIGKVMSSTERHSLTELLTLRSQPPESRTGRHRVLTPEVETVSLRVSRPWACIST